MKPSSITKIVIIATMLVGTLFSFSQNNIGTKTIVTNSKPGLWSDSTIWINNRIPGNNDVIILSHALVFDKDVSCNALNLNGFNVIVNPGVKVNVQGKSLNPDTDSIRTFNLPELYNIDTLQAIIKQGDLEYHYYGKRNNNGELIKISRSNYNLIGGADTIVHCIYDDSTRVQIMYMSNKLGNDTSIYKFVYLDSLVFISRFKVDWANNILSLREIGASRKVQSFYAPLGVSLFSKEIQDIDIAEIAAGHAAQGLGAVAFVFIGIVAGWAVLPAVIGVSATNGAILGGLGAAIFSKLANAEEANSYSMVTQIPNSPDYTNLLNNNPNLNDPTWNGTLFPYIVGTVISDIELNSAFSGGNVLFDGGSNVTSRGICWNSLPNPSIENNTIGGGSGLGMFSSKITGLLPKTQYYVRAFATNSTGTHYGSQQSFRTIGLADVATGSVSNIDSISATVTGNILDDGGTPVLEKGICIDLAQNPTINNEKIPAPGESGEFSINFSSLKPSTTYYLRAYAVNKAGTSYGNNVSFTTLPNEMEESTFTDSRDGQVYKIKRIGNQVWMTENLKYISPGSYCYENNASNCATYGRLYDWNQAKAAVPPGWHLPSDAEWETLVNFLGGADQAGGAMKSTGTTFWLNPNVGATNSSGFNGIPAGNRNTFGTNFANIGIRAFWWSSTINPSNSGQAFNRVLDNESTTVGRGSANRADGRTHFSVRLIKD